MLNVKFKMYVRYDTENHCSVYDEYEGRLHDWTQETNDAGFIVAKAICHDVKTGQVYLPKATDVTLVGSDIGVKEKSSDK